MSFYAILWYSAFTIVMIRSPAISKSSMTVSSISFGVIGLVLLWREKPYFLSISSRIRSFDCSPKIFRIFKNADRNRLFSKVGSVDTVSRSGFNVYL